MKKKLAILITALMALGLAACGGGSDSASAASSAAEEAAVKGEIFDTTEFSALVPEGWMAFPVSDVFSEEEDAVDTSQLYIYKGAESEMDMFSKCGATITHIGKDTTYWSAKDWYDNVEDKDPVTTGATTWELYTGESFEVPCAVFHTGEDGGDQFSVTFILSADDGKETINYDDDDVLAILGSLTVD